MLDWLCYQALIWLPLWKLPPSGRVNGFVLPRAGNYVYRDAKD